MFTQRTVSMCSALQRTKRSAITVARKLQSGRASYAMQKWRSRSCFCCPTYLAPTPACSLAGGATQLGGRTDNVMVVQQSVGRASASVRPSVPVHHPTARHCLNARSLAAPNFPTLCINVWTASQRSLFPTVSRTVSQTAGGFALKIVFPCVTNVDLWTRLKPLSAFFHADF